MIIKLALILLENFITAFEALVNELSSDLSSVIDWFEDNYIGRLNRDKTRRQ